MNNPLSSHVFTGLDVAASQGFPQLRGQRVGAVVNPTSVSRDLDHLVDLLHRAPGVELAAILGPEHGARADAQDMIGVSAGVDRRTGVVVHSLYGSDPASLTPTSDQLSGLGVLVFDIQDVGSRYYTFAATMKYAMIAAAQHQLKFVVLDRPNPIGGAHVEGPTILPGFESFVGAHPLPIRHGLTVGELALLFKRELKLDLDLTIVSCTGLQRAMTYQDTGLPWVLPSPNMPTPETALVYPGGCLIEGTNLSEGRGTTKPFELWGAPWLDPDTLSAKANALGLPGVRFRACSFRPTFHKHAGTLCHGAQPHVTNPSTFMPVATYTALLILARSQDPLAFTWRTEPYEFISNPIAIDLLYGSSREREAIESAVDWKEIASNWEKDEKAFRDRTTSVGLYE